MAATIKHKYTSAIPDGGDTSLVQPSNWNDMHDLTGTIPLANGGTNADLSATGPGFLKQASNGAAVTIALPTATDVGLGSVTNDAQTKAAIVPNTAPSAGQIHVGNAGGTAFAAVSLSGDGTLASTGAISITKTGGVSFAASATTDTTNAANIGSGTLPNGRLVAVPNSALANSSLTIAGHSVALGGTQTISASDIGLGSVTNDVQAKAAVYPNGAFPGQLMVNKAIDFSQGNTDFSFSVALPSGISRYIIQSVRLSGASASLSGATASVWSAAGGTGTAIVANSTSITLAVTTDNTASNAQNLTSAIPATETVNFTTVFFRVQSTAAGTATFSYFYLPMS